MKIRIKNFNFGTISLDKFNKLNDLSLDLKDGDVVGLEGYNGAGKTTLLRILNNIYPFEGTIENKKVISLIDVSACIDDEFNVEDNLNYMFSCYNLDKYNNKELQKRIINFADLENEKNKILRNFSSGMISRLSVSFILHQDANIFLLDEGISTVDFMFKDKLKKKIFDLKKSGKIFILASHNKEIIKDYCNKAIDFNNKSISLKNISINSENNTY